LECNVSYEIVHLHVRELIVLVPNITSIYLVDLHLSVFFFGKLMCLYVSLN
jgi:hypothetical protein